MLNPVEPVLWLWPDAARTGWARRRRSSMWGPWLAGTPQPVARCSNWSTTLVTNASGEWRRGVRGPAPARPSALRAYATADIKDPSACGAGPLCGRDVPCSWSGAEADDGADDGADDDADDDTLCGLPTIGGVGSIEPVRAHCSAARAKANACAGLARAGGRMGALRSGVVALCCVDAWSVRPGASAGASTPTLALACVDAG